MAARPARQRKPLYEPEDLQLRPQPTPTSRLIVLRVVVVLGACGYFLSKWLQPVLLPHGPAVAEPPVRDLSVPWYTSRSAIAKTYQNKLRFSQGRTYQIRAPGIVGPETVLTWKDRVFVLTETAQLLELTDLPTKQQELMTAANENYVWNATLVVRKHLGIGRPLGGRFHGNALYIADAALGLMQLQNIDSPDSYVELLTNQVSLFQKTSKRRDATYTQVTSPLLFVNSVAVGPVTKKLYFTDSTDIPPERIWKKDRFVWDLLYASKIDLARGKATGRLCEYNPATGVTRVLADQIRFANGVAVDPVNEEYLIVAESTGINVLKYHLNADVKKSVDVLTPEEYLQPEVLVTSLPGYIDNVDCAVIESTTKCFVAIVAEVSAVHMAWKYLPVLMQNVVKTLLMTLPRSWLPEFASRYTGVLVVDPVSGESDYIQDPSGKDMKLLTGVTVSPNHEKLYLGSLHNDYVGVYLLSGGDNQQEESKASGESSGHSAGNEEL